MQIIAIRPEPALSETLTLAQEFDLPVQGIALSRAMACVWTAPEPENFDAILAGSANVFRHGGEELAKLIALPVLAVGAKTAVAAVKAGFTVQMTGEGGLQALVDTLDQFPRRLLKLSARDHVRLTWPEQITAQTCIVYEMEQLDISPAQAKMLQGPAIILLYSASSAAHFRQQCVQLGINIRQITIAALGPRIAEAAGDGWASVHASEKPSEAELLALAQRLWQLKPNAPSGGGAKDQKN